MKQGKKIRLSAEGIIGLIVIAALLCEPIADRLPINQSYWRRVGGKSYYHSEKGDQVTGWYDVDGKRYYFDPNADGAVHTGWLELEGVHYYLDAAGNPAPGWLKAEEGWYYIMPDGAAFTGWLETEEGWCYLNPDGIMHTGWLELEGKRYYLGANGLRITGWAFLDGARYCFGKDGAALTGWLGQGQGRCYLDADGKLHTGWLEADGRTYYLDENGSPCTGWLEENGELYYLDANGNPIIGWQTIGDAQYYFCEDGAAAQGTVVIDEQTHHFTSAGKEILLVNRWNPLPEDFSVNLVYSQYGSRVDAVCDQALRQMLTDCRAAGFSPAICSSYRSVGLQKSLFDRQMGLWRWRSSSYEEAYETASQIVAIPGTSEHHTGLALDIVDGNYGALNERQAETKTQKWLMEHCWEYGFILRYPIGTTEWTGIVYEPWHYRYVGLELARELHELDMCLEEYLQMLTDGETI